MPKPTTEKHFEYFQERFRYWADFLGEHGWRFYFDHVDMAEAFARILTNPHARVATIEFTTNWSLDSRPLNHASIDESARHEAIHLLCASLEWVASCRYINEGELGAANEELVRKIQEVIERLMSTTPS